MCSEACNADEAMIILQAPNYKIDIVLSNVEMPGSMDGFGLSQWVRANKPGIPIILAGSPARASRTLAAELCESGPMLANRTNRKYSWIGSDARSRRLNG